jgi:hypothetical protein
LIFLLTDAHADTSSRADAFDVSAMMKAANANLFMISLANTPASQLNPPVQLSQLYTRDTITNFWDKFNSVASDETSKHCSVDNVFVKPIEVAVMKRVTTTCTTDVTIIIDTATHTENVKTYLLQIISALPNVRDKEVTLTIIHNSTIYLSLANVDNQREAISNKINQIEYDTSGTATTASSVNTAIEQIRRQGRQIEQQVHIYKQLHYRVCFHLDYHSCQRRNIRRFIVTNSKRG